MKFRKNIILAGVGGQGLLTLASIIAKACINANINVLVSEIHGMAQRGGSVEVHVRIGNVNSPLIPFGAADFIISLEPIEALKAARYLNEKSTVVLNTKMIPPPVVNMGLSKYPDLKEILTKLSEIAGTIYFFNATEIAEKLGNVQMTNVVMLGAFLKVTRMPFNYEHVVNAIKQVLPEKYWEINTNAFKAGFGSNLNLVKKKYG